MTQRTARPDGKRDKQPDEDNEANHHDLVLSHETLP
jgi:hypothetical protein